MALDELGAILSKNGEIHSTKYVHRFCLFWLILIAIVHCLFCLMKCFVCTSFASILHILLWARKNVQSFAKNIIPIGKSSLLTGRIYFATVQDMHACHWPLSLVIHVECVVMHDDVIKWKHFPRVTGHLCVEFTGPRWIPRTKASDAELWCFLWSASWINGWVNNREADDLRRHRALYEVIAMAAITMPSHSHYVFYQALPMDTPCTCEITPDAPQTSEENAR